MTRRVLIAEDNVELAQLLALHLSDAGHRVDISHDGLSALRQFSAQRYDLIVLDIMLPGIDGLEVCRRLRAEGPYVPILMLTAKSAELDRVLGLEIGADDYVTKPFSLNELLARVKALFRRVDNLSAAPERDFIQHGSLSIDIGKRTVAIAESTVELTAKEFDLLVQFAAHPGRVYSRAQLLDAVWGCGHEGYEHTVNSHINRLRAKIERDPAHPQFVLTVWGVGYKFSENPG